MKKLFKLKIEKIIQFYRFQTDVNSKKKNKQKNRNIILCLIHRLPRTHPLIYSFSKNPTRDSTAFTCQLSSGWYNPEKKTRSVDLQQ